MTTQGNQNIVVEIPGESRRDLVETVERQAQPAWSCGGQSAGPGTSRPHAEAEPTGGAAPAKPSPCRHRPGVAAALPSEYGR